MRDRSPGRFWSQQSKLCCKFWICERVSDLEFPIGLLIGFLTSFPIVLNRFSDRIFPSSTFIRFPWLLIWGLHKSESILLVSYVLLPGRRYLWDCQKAVLKPCTLRKTPADPNHTSVRAKALQSKTCTWWISEACSYAVFNLLCLCSLGQIFRRLSTYVVIKIRVAFLAMSSWLKRIQRILNAWRRLRCKIFFVCCTSMSLLKTQRASFVKVTLLTWSCYLLKDWVQETSLSHMLVSNETEKTRISWFVASCCDLLMSKPSARFEWHVNRLEALSSGMTVFLCVFF